MRALLLSVVLFSVPALVQAQSASSGVISTEAARLLGLERMWFTQLSLDRGRGGMAGIFIHVSSTQAHTVFEFTYEGKRHVFSERDRDAFGKELGVEGARKRATEEAEAIQKAQQQAGKADTQAPTIAEFVVPKITLYASSQRGTVNAIDGETGRTLWSVGIGNPDYPTTAPGANDEYVGLSNGSTIYVLRAEDGSVAWSRPAAAISAAGPALTGDHMFVPMVNGKVESFLLSDSTRPAGMFRSFGRALVQPAVSTHSVAWPTDKGNLYIGRIDGPGVRFRIEAGDDILSPPAFLAPDKIYFTTSGGYLYCVSEEKGNIFWRFTTGERISHSPICLGNTVYLITDRGTMYALDAATADERWIIGGIRHYLAGNEKRLYCLDNAGNLLALDAATGSRIGSLRVGRSEVPVLNSQTDRIFLVTPTGHIQCLREVGRPWPVVHYQIEHEKKTAKTPQLPATKKEAKPAGQSDPFGGADPFGGSAPATPASPPPAAGADPFATP
jgi:outer membrane protein assembly factor BamB